MPLAPRILLLDDDRDLRALARAALEPLEATCTEASSVPEALARVDLLVVGSVADASGLELVEALRAAGQNARVVLLATLWWDESTARRVTKLNIRQVLALPLNPEELHLAAWIALHFDDTAPPPSNDRSDQTDLLRLTVIRALPERIASLEVALEAAFRGETGARDRAKYLANKLSSVAGAFGLEALSEAAGCLERLLAGNLRNDDAALAEARLLLTRARAGSRTHRAPVPPGAVDNARLVALLVDEQDTFLDGYGSVGPNHRVQLLRARSREEALECAARRRPDIAFVARELALPAEGPDVVTALRSQPGLEHLPLVIHGGDGSFGLHQRAAELEVVALLPAPPTPEDLLDCVQRLEITAEPGRVLLLSPRESLVRPLERHGLDVRRESQPLRLVEMATSFEPHVILLDALMGGPGPLAQLRNLAISATTRDIPVVIANLPADPEIRAAALKNGAADVLHPDLHEGELVERISGLARRRMRERRPHEPNTGLLVGSLFREMVDRRLSEARRRAETVSVGLIGVDGRRALRTRLGASGLARVEAHVARRLSTGFRRHDLMGAHREGTFAVVFLEERPSSARLALQRVLGLVRSLRFVGPEGRLPVNCSAGVVAFPVSGTTSEELLDAAERLLDKAREEGGDRVLAG